MKTDIPQARGILNRALEEKHLGTTHDLVKEALALMTRQPMKKRVERQNRVTSAMRCAIMDFLTSGNDEDLTDTEIAERFIGHASAAGRVSEIRNGVVT